MKRHKKDCNNNCETCKPVDEATYQKFTDKEKDSEAERSKCRGQQTVERIIGDIPKGHSTAITEWHYGNQ